VLAVVGVVEEVHPQHVHVQHHLHDVSVAPEGFLLCLLEHDLQIVGLALAQCQTLLEIEYIRIFVLFFVLLFVSVSIGIYIYI